MEKITVKSTLDGKDYEKVTMFGAFTKSRLLPLVLCFSIPVSLLQIMEVINSLMAQRTNSEDMIYIGE